MSEKANAPLLGEELPAPFINRFYFSLTGGMARLSFGELVYGGSPKEHPRAVVSMSLSDAAELAALLNNVLAQHSDLLSQAQKKAN